MSEFDKLHLKLTRNQITRREFLSRMAALGRFC